MVGKVHGVGKKLWRTNSEPGKKTSKGCIVHQDNTEENCIAPFGSVEKVEGNLTVFLSEMYM